ncbi:hypothetical protein CRENBAI_014553 [Crenichthys baileyi]|uniref:Uncharacterized protein n=1 Tax=Crenichthys baileyi TaxID=28760 RepID=A0AAV9R4U2_9TELE
MQVLEWNGVPLTGKTYEEVQCIMGKPCVEAELCVRLDLNMLSDPEHPQALEHQVQLKAAGGQRSPGVDPTQLAAELQRVSQQQAPDIAGTGPGGLGSSLHWNILLSFTLAPNQQPPVGSQALASRHPLPSTRNSDTR